MAEGSAGGKPADFFVGLVDFFAILLPGAMLVFVLYTAAEVSGATVPRLNDPEGWVGFAAFALVSYVLGHLLFVVGSVCIDPLYDLWKHSFRVWDDDRGMARLWKGLRERQKLQDEAKPYGFTGLSVATVYLRLWNPGAAAEMDRLEADQKFFRSLILVLLVAWAVLAWDPSSPLLPWVGLAPLLAGVVLGKVFKNWWDDTDESYEKQHKDNSALGDADHRNKKLDTADKNKRQRMAKRGAAGLALVMIGWVWWFFMTPQPRPQWSTPEVERPAVLTVSAKAGDLSLIANAQGQASEDPIVTMIKKYPRGVRSVILLGLALSLLRFVQQRLKYSNFVYRATKVLNTIKAPAVPTAGH